MFKKDEFIRFVDENLMSKMSKEKIPQEVALYWDALRSSSVEEKPLITDNGKIVLKFLQEHLDTPLWKSRDIANEINVSARTISGAMRKLVSDGFVEKIGQDPIIYTITNKGKDFIIN